MTPQEKKKALRAEALLRRAARGEAELSRLSDALCRHIAACDAFSGCDCLLLYAPVRGEIDVTPLRAFADAREIPVGYPRTEENGGMTYRRVLPGTVLLPGAYRIPAPDALAPGIPLTAHTLLLVPALMGDRFGYRLGYGGGYFDRFLPAFPGTVLGVLPVEEIVEELPRDTHDLPLPAFVTQNGLIFCPHPASPGQDVSQTKSER